MTKFKKGDKFIPRKPKENAADLAWIYHMDIYDGVTLEVYEITKRGNLRAEENSWVFHPDWCEKVGDDNKVDMIDGGKYPFIGYPTFSATEKTIDWEQRRYELAKDFGCAAIIGYINSNTDWQPDIEAKRAVKQANEMIKQLKEQ